MKKEELLSIVGGASISGTLVSAFVKVINTVLEVGRSLGSAVRRASSKNLCSF